jgi:hypothetical protein
LPLALNGWNRSPESNTLSTNWVDAMAGQPFAAGRRTFLTKVLNFCCETSGNDKQLAPDGGVHTGGKLSKAVSIFLFC